MSEEENKYIYPIEELDKIIDQMNQGIQPMISDEMMNEVKMRLKEIKSKIFSDDEDDEDDLIDADMQQERQRLLKAQIEKERRKATTHDVVVLEISEEQKRKIREEMSVSLVRSNPNSDYNKTDDELCSSVERSKINEKLKGLKNCYYNQKDWVNAVKIIMEAVDASLGKYGNSDYPWLTYEEAVKQFNEHKIKLKYPIPKLYINYSTMITDKEILKGILSGDVVIRNKKEENESINKKQRKHSNPVPAQYNVVGDMEYQQMVEAHRAGYDTPMSTGIRQTFTSYNPASMPFGNRFATQKNLDSNGDPILYDWTKEGAGEAFFNMTRGRRTDSTDIVNFLNKNNDDMINVEFSSNVQSFLKSMKQDVSRSGGYDYTLPNYMQQSANNNPNINSNAAAIEQELLASIRMNNPSK